MRKQNTSWEQDATPAKFAVICGPPTSRLEQDKGCNCWRKFWLLIWNIVFEYDIVAILSCLRFFFLTPYGISRTGNQTFVEGYYVSGQAFKSYVMNDGLTIGFPNMFLEANLCI